MVDFDFATLWSVGKRAAATAFVSGDFKIFDRVNAVAKTQVAVRAVQMDAPKTSGPEGERALPMPGSQIA